MFHETFVLIRHCFYGVVDVLFLIFVWRAAIVLSRSADEKWRIHLSWIVPFVIGAATQVLYRTVENTRYFLDGKINYAILDPIDIIMMVGDFLTLVGAYRLFRLLRRVVLANSLVHQKVEDWPQTPTQPAPVAPAPELNPWHPK